ncbi:Natural Cytotoxicity Triggering Receptor 3 Ligand 1 [Manis pentadactyla]|nr:Natural Cytotoxicity Triggering Receptor 3 Ligand 1 [Manis pentadactyla]
MPTRDMEKYPLDGTLNPNTLMQLDIFCNELSMWAKIPYVQALLPDCIAPYYAFLILFSDASLSRLPHRDEFLPSQSIWGLDSDRLVTDPEKTLREKRLILCNTAWPQCQPGDREKYTLDGTLNPNTLMQLDIFCNELNRSGDAEKEKTDPLQHSLPPMPTRDMEKYPLDGTLNPNTLMQLYFFCKQTDPETLREKRLILCNTAWPQCQPGDREKYTLDGTLNPNTLMQLDIFCNELNRSGDAEKEKTDPLQHSLPPMPTRDMEKYPLDGTLNPNTLMQLYIFCKQTDPETLREKRLILCNTAWPQCQPGDREKYTLDGTLNPNTLMQLDIFCNELNRSGDAEKEKTDPLQHSLPPMPTRDMEKYPLDGTLNPNTLMQLDIFCNELSMWAKIPYVQALLAECIAPYYAFSILFSDASLSR